MSVEVHLTQGLVALVDECDASWVLEHNWHASWGCSGKSKSAYASRQTTVPGGQRQVQFHREMARLAGWLTSETLQIDHIDGNGLNNTRANLRAVSASHNRTNRRHRKVNPTSRFLRVTKVKYGRWLASVGEHKQPGQVRGRNLKVGTFVCEVEAGLFADLVARHFHGEHASLNFPEILAGLPGFYEISDEQLVAAIAQARVHV